MNNTQHITILLFRFIRNELTQEEELELSKWRSLSVENERFFQRETDPEHLRSEISQIYASKDRVLKKIKGQYPFTDSVRMELFMRSRRFQRIAAIFMIAIAAVFLLIKLRINQANRSNELLAGTSRATLVFPDGAARDLDGGEPMYVAVGNPGAKKEAYYRLYTPRGGEFWLKLPDHTLLKLNAQSSIKYPANFSGDSINLVVEGEGYFEVDRKSKAPLRIAIPGMQLETSGARFNITAYPDDSMSTITMLEGNMLIHPKQASSGFILYPGQQVQMSAGRLISLQDADTTQIIAWKNGRTYFKDASVQYIMQRISRWYNIDVYYQGKISDKMFKVDLYRNAPLLDLLNILKHQGIRYTIEKRTITISLQQESPIPPEARQGLFGFAGIAQLSPGTVIWLTAPSTLPATAR